MQFSIPGLGKNKELEELKRLVAAGGGGAAGLEDLKGDNHNLSISHSTPAGVGSHTIATVETGASPTGSYRVELTGNVIIEGIGHQIDMKCSVIPSSPTKLQVFGISVKSPVWNVSVLDGTNKLSVSLTKAPANSQMYSLSVSVRPISLDPKDFKVTYDASAGYKVQRFF